MKVYMLWTTSLLTFMVSLISLSLTCAYYLHRKEIVWYMLFVGLFGVIYGIWGMVKFSRIIEENYE